MYMYIHIHTQEVPYDGLDDDTTRTICAASLKLLPTILVPPKLLPPTLLPPTDPNLDKLDTEPENAVLVPK